MLFRLTLLALLGMWFVLSGCTTDTNVGITTNQGPRVQETPDR